MKLFKLIIAVVMAVPMYAFGLADTSAPTKIQIPFGNSAGGAYKRTVPVASQIGIQNGAASYTDGFPPLNFTPVNAGGVPPFGQDMNGILYDVSAHARWWAAGGPVYYDSAYQTTIGGYPKGACVQSTVTPARLWCSTVNNNTSNPDTGGAGWQYPNNAVTATNQSGGTVAATTISASGQITSTVSTGTAPFVVSSTTPVANLNIGGNSATALGYNQTWQDLFASRALNTPYTNNTGKPIAVFIAAYVPNGGAASLYVDSVEVGYGDNNLGITTTFVFNTIVPNGSVYQLSNASSIRRWKELR